MDVSLQIVSLGFIIRVGVTEGWVPSDCVSQEYVIRDSVANGFVPTDCVLRVVSFELV